MTLLPYEFQRIEYLLGKYKQVGLIPSEEWELRDLLAKEQPSARDKSLDDLITLGLIIVGMYILYKIFED